MVEEFFTTWSTLYWYKVKPISPLSLKTVFNHVIFPITNGQLNFVVRSYRLIRRRISSLLGSLLASDPSPTSLPLIYELLTHLLSRNSSTDPAIRLTSVKSLQKSDTWDFNLQAFLPFLSRVVEDLVDLLESVELGETRMRVMSALGVVVARVEGNVSSIRFLSLSRFLKPGENADGARKEWV